MADTMGEEAGWQEAVASPGDPKAVVRAEGEEEGEEGRERGSQEGEREGRGEGWLRLGNPMGCLGRGPERRFSSNCTGVSARYQLASTMTQYPGGFIIILAATKKHPVFQLQVKRNPAALPPSPPPQSREWPACEVSKPSLGLESALPLTPE